MCTQVNRLELLIHYIKRFLDWNFLAYRWRVRVSVFCRKCWLIYHLYMSVESSAKHALSTAVFSHLLIAREEVGKVKTSLVKQRSKLHTQQNTIHLDHLDCLRKGILLTHSDSAISNVYNILTLSMRRWMTSLDGFQQLPEIKRAQIRHWIGRWNSRCIFVTRWIRLSHIIFHWIKWIKSMVTVVTIWTAHIRWTTSRMAFFSMRRKRE